MDKNALRLFESYPRFILIRAAESNFYDFCLLHQGLLQEIGFRGINTPFKYINNATQNYISMFCAAITFSQYFKSV